MSCVSKRVEVSGYLRDNKRVRVVLMTLSTSRLVTIGTLSDDELLEIFSFYVAKAYETYEADRNDKFDSKQLEAWYTLIHVCQRWRILVFGSSRRLNLRLLCTINRPVKRRTESDEPIP